MSRMFSFAKTLERPKTFPKVGVGGLRHMSTVQGQRSFVLSGVQSEDSRRELSEELKSSFGDGRSI